MAWLGREFQNRARPERPADFSLSVRMLKRNVAAELGSGTFLRWRRSCLRSLPVESFLIIIET